MILIGQHTARRAAGHTFETSLDGKLIEHDTLQCKHCGCHWQVIPGSGRQRGWCRSCGGPTCGSPQCVECVPAEKRLDLLEKFQGAYLLGGVYQ